MSATDAASAPARVGSRRALPSPAKRLPVGLAPALQRIGLAALGAALLVGSWQVVSALHLFPAVVFPAPLTVARAGRAMFSDGTLQADTVASLRRVGAGFALGSVLGVGVGVLTARSTVAGLILQPMLRLFAPVPTIALIPLAVLWFGLGEQSKLFLVAAGVFVPVWINAHSGVAGTPKDYLQVCRCLGASRWQVLRGVVLPESLPDIVTGLRVGVATAFVLIVASELNGTTVGLGYRLEEAQLFSQADRLMFCLIVLGVLGAACDQLIARTFAPVIAWSKAST